MCRFRRHVAEATANRVIEGGGGYVWGSYGEQHLYWRQYYNWHPPYIPRSDMFTRSDMYHTHDPTAKL
eukprot:COSAG06_NODE_11854_length_1456_cov_1.576271_1_plen_68_part_00